MSRKGDTAFILALLTQKFLHNWEKMLILGFPIAGSPKKAPDKGSMGSIRVSPPRGALDRVDRDVQLSPRRPRPRDETDSKTLPSISDLLPEMGSNSNAPPSHRAPERSPPYRYRLSPPATSSRPSPTNPAFPDRYQTPSRRDDYPLPYHSGPPGERGPPGPSTPTWSDRRSMSTAVSGPPYAPHTPQPYSGPPPPPYGGSGVGTPGSRSRDDDYRTGLPPPPPQHYMNDPGRDSAPYPRPRESAYDEGRYDNPHWHDNSRPPYPPYPPSTSRDGGAGPYDPRASSRGAPPNPGYHPGEGYGPQYSHLPPMNFDARDEPPRKRRGNLPRWITDLLKAWFLEHIAHPYPSEQEKNELCLQTGCSMTQISNWFINARRRRTPELTRQAEAERRLRDHVGRSGSNSD